MQTVIYLLIANAKNRLQFAEKWGLIMIKKPHAEKTLTGIQQSVPDDHRSSQSAGPTM